MCAGTGVVGCKAAALQGLAPVGRIPRVKRRRGLPSAHHAGRGVWESVISVCAHRARAPVPKEAQGGGPKACNLTASAQTNKQTRRALFDDDDDDYDSGFRQFVNDGDAAADGL